MLKREKEKERKEKEHMVQPWRTRFHLKTKTKTVTDNRSQMPCDTYIKGAFRTRKEIQKQTENLIR